MLFRKFKKLAGLSITSVVVGLVFAAMFAPSASAAGWTVLGGDPLFQGGIPNASQQGRNKFVHDMLSPKGVTAQKRAGLGAKERQALKQALVHGEFKNCRLHVGDHFEAMSYGVGAVLVDRNVTFGDTRYSGQGAPAFCLSVEVGKSGVIINIKVPFKCENFSVVNRVHRKPHKPHHKKPHKPKRHHKKKPAPECSTKSPNGGGGNCVQQVVTVTPKQECEANNHSGTNCQQTTTTIVANCSNVNYGENTNVNQGGNCNSGGTETCVGQSNCTTHEEETCVNNSCNVTPPPEEPCGCKPPEEPEKPKSPPSIAIEALNDFIVSESSVICARVGAPAGDSLSVTFFSENGGEFASHGVATPRPGVANEWCSPYTAPSEVPPGGKDELKAVGLDNTTGLSATDVKFAPIKPETF